MVTCRIVQTTDADEWQLPWDAYIIGNNLPGLSAWRWAELIETIYHRETLRIIALDEAQEITGYIMAYHAPYKYAQLYSANFGFHAQDEATAKGLIQVLQDYCAEKGIQKSLISMGVHNYVASEAAVQKTNMLLPIVSQDEDMLWSQTPKKTRNMVRKAEKNGYSLSRDWSHIDAFYTLYETSFHAKALSMKPSHYFHEQKKMFGDDLILLTALKNNQPHAAMIFLKQGNVVSYLYNASTKAAASDGANNFLMWEALKHCAAQGISMIELGEATEGGAVYNFKKRISSEIQITPIYYTNALSAASGKTTLSLPERFTALSMRLYKILPTAVQKALLKRADQIGRVV